MSSIGRAAQSGANMFVGAFGSTFKSIFRILIMLTFAVVVLYIGGKIAHGIWAIFTDSVDIFYLLRLKVELIGVTIFTVLTYAAMGIVLVFAAVVSNIMQLFNRDAIKAIWKDSAESDSPIILYMVKTIATSTINISPLIVAMLFCTCGINAINNAKQSYSFLSVDANGNLVQSFTPAGAAIKNAELTKMGHPEVANLNSFIQYPIPTTQAITPTAAATTPTTDKVQQGETLSQFATRHQLSVQQLIQLNEGITPTYQTKAHEILNIK